MAIKVLKEAGFTKEDHILTLIRKVGQPVRAEVRVKDREHGGEFVTFTSPLPISKALDVIRRTHNADVINGVITAHRMLPMTAEVQEALIRVYEVAGPEYNARG